MPNRQTPQFDYLFPPEECELVYSVLDGKPELDPCGHPQQFMEAHNICYCTSPDDDGFRSDWSEFGSVFLNPPHGEREPNWSMVGVSRPAWRWRGFSKWVAKASIEAQKGCTVIAFMPASTDRKWFHYYVSECTSLVFLNRRVKCFVPPNTKYGEPERGPQPMNAHMVVLWTKDYATSERFYHTYKNRGMVVEPQPIGE